MAARKKTKKKTTARQAKAVQTPEATVTSESNDPDKNEDPSPDQAVTEEGDILPVDQPPEEPDEFDEVDENAEPDFDADETEEKGGKS